MRADLIRIYKSVHTWAGILSGMALFIAFYAGALTVFKEPITQWAAPPVASPWRPLEDAQALIGKTLAEQPAAAREFTIHLRQSEHLPGRLQWQVRGAPDADEHDESGRRHFVASLDAGGQLQVSETHPSALASFIDVLHRVVGLPFDTDPNRWVMGLVATLYALALVSGVMVLLPSLVKDFFALRVGKNLKRMWLDAHNVVGIISLPFHLVMALTAVVFAFHDPIYELQNELVHGGQWRVGGPRGAAKAEAPLRQPDALLTPLALVERAKALSPGFEPDRVQYQNVTGLKPVARVWGHDAAAVSPRARGGFVALHPYTGQVLSTDYLPGQQSAAYQVIGSFFALHMASFGGHAVQWMYFLLGLAGAWLFYSGNLLWVESRRRRTQPKVGGHPVQRLDCRLMAAATVGVCLGCVCSISLMMVAHKWMQGQVPDLSHWTRLAYYLTFFGALAWAFWQGGARASVHLLWAATCLTLALPATRILAWLAPEWAPAVNDSVAAMGVDATALGGALVLAWMARVTQRRVQQGPRDSVWSATLSTAEPEPVLPARPVQVRTADPDRLDPLA
ncbi:PepSY-associated TM helix domain-containing protein [Curvibacter sp. HBC28]|uniref:PepSY-associated TM helix domain-containing protein n=1 Tax=Curvibacter microcysteis TaxID=3026419 RepID=A0ABT5MDV9_9BURK|nr:PepSY-associated TM helix domain-containing protein [Curvibacter sp. HBC28]MDD0814775.1 PepSY-associated TM helix domain-containing protein [Curvibacter sp. HBC28]